MKKRNLTRTKICETAILLIEKEGLSQLSMRKLAAALNVEAASLYNHIKNKYELFDLIQEFLYAKIALKANEDHWKNHLHELISYTREGLLKFPQIAVLFATRPTITPSSLNQIEKTLNILIKAGFKKSEVLAIYRNLHAFVLGHVLAEVGHVPNETEEPTLTHLHLDQYPTLKKAFNARPKNDFDMGFKLGLNNILNGLELLLMRKSSC